MVSSISLRPCPSGGAPQLDPEPSIGLRRPLPIGSCRTPCTLLLVGVLATAGCGAGPRGRVVAAVAAGDVPRAIGEYESFRRHDGPDGELLAEVAGLILEQEALGPSPAMPSAHRATMRTDGDGAAEAERRSTTAFAQLVLAGTQGSPIIERLAAQRGAWLLRAKALGTLVDRGDEDARRELRALLDDDSGLVVAEAVRSLDPRRDHERILALAGHPHAAVRQRAVRMLASSAPDGRSRALLSEVARVDPDGGVRAAAVRSLGAFGRSAIDVLRDRLGDPDHGVRMAAVGALVAADRELGLMAVEPLLGMAPTASGIEAARWLAQGDADQAGNGVVTARAFLLRALAAADAAARAQAAIALTSLRADPTIDRALLEALATEDDDQVRLSLATALAGRDGAETASREALLALSAGDGIPAIQASALLAADGHAEALARLKRALRSPNATERRVTARLLAREVLQPDAARPALRDRDAMVRIHAAGGILAAAAYL